MTAVVLVASKPHLQSALRDTWRKSGQHAAEQAKRFLRLFILSAIPALTSLYMSGTTHFDKKTLLALLVPIAETAYRQVFPALGAKGVDEADGVTIVPDQVGAQAVDTSVDETPDPSVDPQTGDTSVDNLPAEPSDSENSVTDLPDPAANEPLPLVAPLPVPKKKAVKKTPPK